MLKKIVAIVLALTASVAIVFAITMFAMRDEFNNSKSVYSEPLIAPSPEADPLTYMAEDFTISKDFSSHLPLVILDMDGKEPPVSTRYDVDKMYDVTIPDVEPYVNGTISLIEGNARNSLSNPPSITSNMAIKRRGNYSMRFEKPQYMVKFLNNQGEYNPYSVLGMGEDHEWILTGSIRDKSMLRNYLSYRLSSQVQPYVPEFQYCEVIIKKDNAYYYHGVYLLGESVKQSEYRLNISDYKSSSINNSYLIRRDRFDEEGIMLSTFPTDKGLTHLGLLYPRPRKITKESKAVIEKEIGEIKKILYSDDQLVFSSYPNYIDVDSFVDYFLLNEFLENYDAGYYSTYMYKDIGGKLRMGPVWDFDGAMDNFNLAPSNPEHLAFYTSPFFDRLIKDQYFVERLEKRYAELRRGVLSEKNVVSVIDEITTYLGPAKEREWKRWNTYYTTTVEGITLGNYTDQNGITYYRDLETYDYEIFKIKTLLRKHGDAIASNLSIFKKQCVYNTNPKSQKGALLFLCFSAFAVPLVFISRKK